ncbi:unnamed protein product, partial [Phaedon cochleariae]
QPQTIIKLTYLIINKDINIQFGSLNWIDYTYQIIILVHGLWEIGVIRYLIVSMEPAIKNIVVSYAVSTILNMEMESALKCIFAGEDDSDILHEIMDSMCNEEVPKSENFYEIVIPRFNTKTFQSHFRMTPECFHFILNKLENTDEFRKTEHEQFGGRERINTEKTLLVAVWCLANPESYRSVGDRFNITKYSVHHLIHTVVQAVNKYLCHIFIRWPTNIEKNVIAEHYSKYGLKKVIGAIDGCHIPIKKPQDDGTYYFNRKKFYSVILQGVCKDNLMFTDVDVRWPGSVHDARVFRTSDLFTVGHRLCAPDYYLIGDSAYPSNNWLLTPYKNNGNLIQCQKTFNKVLSKTRVKIEHSFGLLKGRFRRIKELLDMKYMHNINSTIVACCVLHNICLFKGDEDIRQYIRDGTDGSDINDSEDNEIHYGNYFMEDNDGILFRNTVAQDLLHSIQ